MEDNQHLAETGVQEAGTVSPASFKVQFGAASSMVIASGVIDLLAHGGWAGFIVGGGLAAFVAWKHGPDVISGVQSALPELPEPPRYRVKPKHERNWWQRAWGIEPEERLPLEGSEDKSLPAVGDDVYYDDECDEANARYTSPVPQPEQVARPSSDDYVPVNALDLAKDVRIPLGDLAGKAIFVCGIRRHGKTTLGARLAEQLGKHYIPLFIPCLEGDYLSLADVLPRAIVAGHSSVTANYRAYSFVQLDEQKTAYRLGYDIFETGYQVILDMASYTSLDTAVAMQVNVIRGMFHWANTHPDKRVTGHVFLDEAQRYLPQTLSDSVILDKAVLSALLRAYMDIIAIGGKRGIAPVILTQRFAQVNKKIMAQSEVFFLMRQTNDGDLDRCMEYVNSDVATKEQISRFQPGQGVYIASDGTQLVTRFKQRESSGQRSSTPQAEGAYRYASMPMPGPVMEFPQQMRQAWVENAPAMMPMEEEKASAMPAPVLPEKSRRAEDVDLARAIRLWNAGINTVSLIEETYELTNHQARRLRQMILDQAGATSDVSERAVE